jgi:anionic cell wall polymer biosynthesis LytR-Cps2A-Psr (LCP) family protein
MQAKFHAERRVWFLAAIAVIILFTTIQIYGLVRTDEVLHIANTEELIPTLFIVHEDQNVLLSQVFFLNPRTGMASLIDIDPRLGTILSSVNLFDRIDSIFRPNNPEEYLDEVSRVLGYEVPFYMQFSVQELSDIIDLARGIELFNPNSVESNDILLPAGSVTLDGPKAISFMKMELAAESDTERIARKHKTIQALIRRIGEKPSYFLNSQVFSFIYRQTKTNFSKRAYQSYIGFFENIKLDRMILQKSLGTVNSSENGLAMLILHREGKWLKEGVKQIVSSLEKDSLGISTTFQLNLVILNGTDRNGLASRTARIFENFGFSVSEIANADRDSYDKTVIQDHTGDLELIRQVAEVIRCENIIQKDSLNEYADVTIILGKDFDGNYVQN